MSRIYLNVPFRDKDDAKHRGAKWDAQKKAWYVFSNSESDLTPFSSWGFSEPRYILRSPYYYVAQTTVTCFRKRCGETTRAYSILLPAECEMWQQLNDDGTGWWFPWECPTFVSYAMGFSEITVDVLRQLAPTYHPSFSKTAKDTYWINHCEHCRANQGDWYLHDEPGGGFFPTNIESAMHIMLYPMHEVFEGNGEASQTIGGGADLLEDMTVIRE